MFVALATLWGLSFPAISVGLEFVPPLLLAAFRYDTAAIVLLAYAILRTDGWRPRGMNHFQAIAGGGLFLVAGNGLLFIGQQTVPSSVAAIMTSLVPIVTALWAFVLLGERLSRVGVVGVGLGFVGLAFVIQPDPANLLGGDTIGRLIILGQVASVSLGGVIIQRAGPTLDRLPLVGWSMGLGAVVLHVLSALAGERPTIAIADPTAVAAIVYLGVFSTAIAFLLYFSILERYGAFQAALVGYLVPIVATTVGVVVLGEAIGWPTFVGFGLVALGFGLLKRRALAELAGARL
nr:DMT family transporter [Halalkalirubrum salinum]